MVFEKFSELYFINEFKKIAYVLIQVELIVSLLLIADKVVNNSKQGRRQILKVLVELVLDSQMREYVVINKSRSQVCQLARRVPLLILIQMTRDHVVQNSITQELQPLIAVSQRVVDVGGVCKGLEEVGGLLELVANTRFE